MDLQAAVVNHIDGSIPAVTVLLHQVIHNIVKHGIHIPVPIVDVLLFFHAFGILGLVAVKGHGSQLGGGLVVLLLGDGNQLALHLRADIHLLVVPVVNAVGELPHAVQHDLGPGFGLVGENQGIILGGVLGDARDEGALR